MTRWTTLREEKDTSHTASLSFYFFFICSGYKGDYLAAFRFRPRMLSLIRVCPIRNILKIGILSKLINFCSKFKRKKEKKRKRGKKAGPSLSSLIRIWTSHTLLWECEM